MTDQRQEPEDRKSLLYKLEANQRLKREWMSSFSAHEFLLLSQLLDRTIGWGDLSVTVTSNQLLNGYGPYSGMQMSRRQLFTTLKSLSGKGVILRGRAPWGGMRITINPEWSPSACEASATTPIKTPKVESDLSAPRTTQCHTDTTKCNERT
jgi:hypothetical protein